MKRNNLKLFRKNLGLTQEMMARRLGISTSHYQGIELGTQNPSVMVLQKFYENFGNHYDDIWTIFNKEKGDNL